MPDITHLLVSNFSVQYQSTLSEEQYVEDKTAEFFPKTGHILSDFCRKYGYLQLRFILPGQTDPSGIPIYMNTPDEALYQYWEWEEFLPLGTEMIPLATNGGMELYVYAVGLGEPGVYVTLYPPFSDPTEYSFVAFTLEDIFFEGKGLDVLSENYRD